ncbi:MAG: GNAT family N-acetyltransferase [Pyrinomonadaceae bacterium]|nr:GNAT family N-acetyltransferase [Pyrinomonadaceae bacterium]
MIVTSEEPFIFSDLTLARRLERTEAQSNREFVEARATIFPESGARWIEVAGVYAMYDGIKSPATQTFGLGMFGTIGAQEMNTIERFFRERGAEVFHEVSPLADLALLPLLNERGYEPVEFTSVMFRPIRREHDRAAQSNERIRVRLVGDDEHEMWARTAEKGWSEFTEYADLMFELSLVGAKRADALSFLAELDDEPIATGALSICDGVALLAGASTVPEGRKRGAQAALLDSRLRFAAERGCDIAMMCALPGSSSQRNAERQGFRIAYTRVKWRLAERAEGFSG